MNLVALGIKIPGVGAAKIKVLPILTKLCCCVGLLGLIYR
jgi:hypothetical protein